MSYYRVIRFLLINFNVYVIFHCCFYISFIGIYKLIFEKIKKLYIYYIRTHIFHVVKISGALHFNQFNGPDFSKSGLRLKHTK